MPLAARSAVAVPAVPGMGGALTCHAATWYWAAKEAQALGLSAVKTDLVTLGNVAAMVPQASMLALIGPGRSANWDFAITPNTPPDGSVLIWPLGGTHSAIVSGVNAISGYNQPVQFPGVGLGHTTNAPGALAANQRMCVVVSEAAIIAAAAAANL
jgi:hypothetical protein